MISLMSRNFVILYRYTFALLGLTAVAIEIIVLINRGIFNPVNFFSYFTILSNLLGIVMLGLFGYFAMTKRVTTNKAYIFKGAVTLYMLMTGVIFALLLAPIKDAILTAVPWDNIVLHYIMPLVICVDWLLLQPKIHISLRASLSWLSFPAVYVAYSLLRGHFVGWYPYPFLNASANGYTQIALTVGLLFGVVIFFSQLVRVAASKAKYNI